MTVLDDTPNGSREERAGRQMTSVAKALQLLDAFRKARADMSLSELARRADVPKSTAFRLLAELEQSGFVARNGTKYRLGLSCFELGARYSMCRPNGLRDTASHFLSHLHTATGLTAHLAVLDGPEILHVEKVQGPNNPVVLTMPGQRHPATCTALGKTLLAFGSSEDVRTALDAGLPRFTPHSITDPRRLMSELKRIRESGVAYNRQELSRELVCVAAPIIVHGTIEAAVSVSGPTAGVRWDRTEMLVRRAAADISAARGRNTSSQI
ncbi:IclR family transcriptional regulator [Rhodococcus sp. Rp3]|uniref:IclR family transcriptional regulator n=1 Tax=Rhodococcus sp. Rp3 TaxID=2807635 RepID=UPI00233F30D7|nr:IclR family transcriptional regulator [Rhodococcus sp. Rp3]MDC3728811.1 IclR family transcriptional regulator [Rhodococcus sp. Rp3]